MPLRRGRRLYRPIRNGMLSGDVDIAAAQHGMDTDLQRAYESAFGDLRLSINVHTRARRPRAYGRSSLLEQNWTQFSDRAVRASSVRVWRCSVRR